MGCEVQKWQDNRFILRIFEIKSFEVNCYKLFIVPMKRGILRNYNTQQRHPFALKIILDQGIITNKYRSTK